MRCGRMRCGDIWRCGGAIKKKEYRVIEWEVVAGQDIEDFLEDEVVYKITVRNNNINYYLYFNTWEGVGDIEYDEGGTEEIAEGILSKFFDWGRTAVETKGLCLNGLKQGISFFEGRFAEEFSEEGLNCNQEIRETPIYKYVRHFFDDYYTGEMTGFVVGEFWDGEGVNMMYDIIHIDGPYTYVKIDKQDDWKIIGSFDDNNGAIIPQEALEFMETQPINERYLGKDVVDKNIAKAGYRKQSPTSYYETQLRSDTIYCNSTTNLFCLYSPWYAFPPATFTIIPDDSTVLRGEIENVGFGEVDCLLYGLNEGETMLTVTDGVDFSEELGPITVSKLQVLAQSSNGSIIRNRETNEVEYNYTGDDPEITLRRIITSPYSLRNDDGTVAFFQWGNNHKFKQGELGGKNTLVGVEIDTTGYGPQNLYYGDKYICPISDQSSNREAQQSLLPWTHNFNLWGGQDNTEIARRGPCPEGWHIPNSYEFDNLLKIIVAVSGITNIYRWPDYFPRDNRTLFWAHSWASSGDGFWLADGVNDGGIDKVYQVYTGSVYSRFGKFLGGQCMGMCVVPFKNMSE